MAISLNGHWCEPHHIDVHRAHPGNAIQMRINKCFALTQDDSSDGHNQDDCFEMISFSLFAMHLHQYLNVILREKKMTFYLFDVCFIGSSITFTSNTFNKQIIVFTKQTSNHNVEFSIHKSTFDA